MTEYARAGVATAACEAADSSPRSVPAHRPGGNRAACRAVIPPLAAAAGRPGVRRAVLVVTGTHGPGRPEMPGGARRCPRGQVPGTVVPLMLAFSQSDAARA